jgi:cytochrome P450
VYKPGTHFKKDPEFYNSHIVDGSFFNVRETKEARPIKDMYQPYFSRAAIQRLEVLIHEKVNKFLDALQGAAKLSEAVDLTLGYKCLTADVVMGYCYQKTFGALDAPDFRFQLILDLEELFQTAPLAWYFPKSVNTLSRVLMNLPKAVVEKILKPLIATFEIQKVCWLSV